MDERGDRYIRHLLYIGAENAIRFAKARAEGGEAWIRSLQERRPPKIVIIALANKMARIAWALMTRGEACARLWSQRDRERGAHSCEDESEVMARPGGRDRIKPVGLGRERARMVKRTPKPSRLATRKLTNKVAPSHCLRSVSVRATTRSATFSGRRGTRDGRLSPSRRPSTPPA